MRFGDGLAVVAATFALGYVGGLVVAPRDEREVRTVRVQPAAQPPVLPIAAALPEYEKPPKPRVREPRRTQVARPPVAVAPAPAPAPPAPAPPATSPARPAPPTPTPAPDAESFDDRGEPNAGEFDYEGDE